MTLKAQMLGAVARYALAELATKGDAGAEDALRALGAPSEAVLAIVRDGFTAETIARAFRAEDGAFFGDTRHRVEVYGVNGAGETVLAFYPVPVAGLAVCLTAAHDKRAEMGDGLPGYPGGVHVREVNSPARYCVGYNAPGYMPEGEPESAGNWSQAVAALASIIEEDRDERLSSAEDDHEGETLAEVLDHIRAAAAGALDALKMAPTPKEEREGLDVVFMGRAYFIRPDEEEAEEGPDRDGWSIGDRAGAFDLGDRGEIVDFPDGQDADGFALARLQLDFYAKGELVTLSVQSLSVLTDD